MNKKKILISLVIAVLLAGTGFYVYSKESKMKKTGDNAQLQGETGDPFAKIVFPEGVDEATRVVMQKNIEGARELYTKMPEAWETWIAIGSLRQMLGDYNGAISAYRQSIVLQSNNVLGYRNMAEVYKNNLNDPEKAQEYYKLALENNAIDSEIYVSLALVQQYKLNNPEEAEKTLLSGLTRVTDKRDILLRLITLYQTTNQSDKQTKAEELLKTLEQKDGEVLETISVQ